MKNLLTCTALSILAIGCQTTSDVKRSQLDRDTIYDTQLDSKTRLEVRLDQDGTARIHLLRNDLTEDIVFQLLYSPADNHIGSFHRLQYDKVGIGLVGGINVSSDSGKLNNISMGEFQGTNFSLLLNRDGNLLPNTRRTYSTELGSKKGQRETIRYGFIPYQANETENK